jgi:predicted  nucleic acid-binding Zn-ribbon protein
MSVQELQSILEREKTEKLELEKSKSMLESELTDLRKQNARKSVLLKDTSSLQDELKALRDKSSKQTQVRSTLALRTSSDTAHLLP